jgi:hypothetical protein
MTHNALSNLEKWLYTFGKAGLTLFSLFFVCTPEQTTMAKPIVKKQPVPLTHRKSGHKGKKCRRGEPVYYDEKKQHLNITLTPFAIAQLEELAGSEGCSRSEVIERWLRSQTQTPST